MIVAILFCVGVHVYFLFKDMIKELLNTIKKVRKKGWLKTFKILRKVQHILQVLTCRTRLDIEFMRESASESSASESGESKQSSSNSKEMSVIEEE